MMEFEERKIREQQQAEIANATKMIQDIQTIAEHDSLMKIKRKHSMLKFIWKILRKIDKMLLR